MTDLTYQGRPVLASAKLVDWHVAYSPSEQYPKGFGYSDAVGCRTFSAAAVPAYDPPQILDVAPPDGKPGFAPQYMTSSRSQ